MKIIKDYEVYEPNECYFGLSAPNEEDDGDNTVIVVIVNKSFWMEENCLNDQFGYHSFDKGVVPEEFQEVMEATWETELNVNEAKELLIKAGFEHNHALDLLVKEGY